MDYKREPAQRKTVQKKHVSLFDEVYAKRTPANSNGMVMSLWKVAMANKPMEVNK